jgi:chromosomal replication initiation ATPase DnaA
MNSGPVAGERGQLAFELGHTASHDEADFIVGEGNALAYAHIQAYPHWPSPLTLLTGPAKAGKSHLARVFAVRSGATLVEAEEVEQLSRSAGTAPLVLEDVDRGGFEEASLFHLVNQSMRDRRPVLMTARKAVASWPFETDDLKSRARLAAHFTVTSSDDIQLSQMFVKLFGDRQVAVDPRVIAYLVSRMERSPEEAVALAGMLDRMALMRGGAITRALAAEALALRGAAHASGQLELDLGDDVDE